MKPTRVLGSDNSVHRLPKGLSRNMKTRRKIVLINHTGGPIIKEDQLAYTEGGLAHALSAVTGLASDYDITILCPDFSGNRQIRVAKYRGVNIISMGTSRWIKWMHAGGPSFCKEANRYIKEAAPDILIGNGVLASFLLRLAPKGPFRIGIIHHLYHASHASNLDNSSKYTMRVMGLLERTALRLIRLDKIAVISPMVQDVLTQKGFSKDKTVVVGNGVNLEDYAFSVNKIPFSLIYIGRLTELKRVSSLIECISTVSNRFPEVKLHIVGDGPKREEVRRSIEAHHLSHNVSMHGYVPEREKIELLSSCTVYVSNSIFEGFGIPLVEAMATGTVPVVSDIEGHRFVFQKKNVGYLVKNTEEMATKIADLLSNETERSRLATNGRRLVEQKWTWEKVAQRYKHLLNDNLAGNADRESFSG
jgi:glycosyltransferase involved in cell wall biosynthesis